MMNQATALLQRLELAGRLASDERVVVETQHRIGGEPVESLLLDYGFVDSEALGKLQVATERVSIDREEFVPDPGAVRLLDEATARKGQALPLAFDPHHDVLTVATASLDDLPWRDRLHRQVRQAAARPVSIRHVLAAPAEIADALNRCYGVSLDLDVILAELCDVKGAQGCGIENVRLPVVRLVDAILHDAVCRRASDIHLGPEEGFVRIRYRVDGVLQQVRCLHDRVWSAMVVRLKVLGDMDIAETRSPQDGHFYKRIHAERVNFRLSSFPLRTGENLVIRVLDRRQAIRRLADLALPASQQAKLSRIIHRPQGMIVVAGPTGSGKSTTLNALLAEHDSEALNIMSLEDPVEYPLLRIRQASVNVGRGLDFVNGVRALLRQDPDVLLIGEIRDADSCGMAFRAAMSGHQVLTTVHANDAVSALYRLRELGASLAFQSDNIAAVISQRLLRRTCSCRSASGVADTSCVLCHGSGYYGRQACLEILELTPVLGRTLLSEPLPGDILQRAEQQGFVCMVTQGRDLVSSGHTTHEELTRVFGVNHSLVDRESESDSIALSSG